MNYPSQRVMLAPGTRVRLCGGSDTAVAVVVAALPRCPNAGCYLPAYRVLREHGAFPGWPGGLGLWHADDTEPVGRRRATAVEPPQASDRAMPRTSAAELTRAQAKARTVNPSLSQRMSRGRARR